AAYLSASRSNLPTVRPTTSSTSACHAPHASQRPPHFGCSAPHSVQRNTERGPPLATAGLGGRFPRRVIVEPRVLLLEEQLHGARGAVALLDRKSTRLNSSHGSISYAVFCLKKKQ